MTTKEEMKKIVVLPFFLATSFHKIVNDFVLEQVKKKIRA